MKRIDPMRKELTERFQFSGVNDIPFNEVEVTYDNALRSVESPPTAGKVVRADGDICEGECYFIDGGSWGDSR